MIYVIFGLIMALYGLICLYIGVNGWFWLKGSFSFKYKKIYIFIIVFLSLNIFMERFISWKFFTYLSGVWMIVILYSIIIFPIANLMYYVTKKKGLKFIGWMVISIYLFLFAYGSYNAWQPKVVTYEIELDKEAPIGELQIMFVSDLHLGEVVGNRHLEKLVKIVDERKPDLLLLGGDIIDDKIGPFMKEQMGETMKKLKAPLGVYGISGNHDYYGGDLERLLIEMEKSGIRILTDEVVLIEDSFYLIGRNDATDRDRLSIEKLTGDIHKDKPIFMLDHQPTQLNEALQNGVDVYMSGHTHHGQLAPVNMITNYLFENDYGYLQKETLHSFVSSGFGVWGPPFRIGSQAEVMEMKIQFQPLMERTEEGHSF